MHSFHKYVVNAKALVKTNTLRGFNKELARQSNTDEAVAKYQVLSGVSEEDYSQFRSPLYYGGGVEFLAESYFSFFGSDYNLIDLKSVDDWDHPERDRGSDHKAVSQKKMKYKGPNIITEPASPVRIQTKGTLNPLKEHKTNDGSRIMNFVASALAEACKSGSAYQTRLILFTLGKGLHYRLEENTYRKIEVVNNKEIARKIDNNPFFWNYVRERFGLSTVKIYTTKDPEGKAIKMELFDDEKQPV